MPTAPIGLDLHADDLAAARRCAHEAVVLAVAELEGAHGDAARDGRERVLARAAAMLALGTETDGDRLLVVLGPEERAALVDGARHVEADLGAGTRARPPGGAAERHAPTLRAARRVRELVGDA